MKKVIVTCLVLLCAAAGIFAATPEELLKEGIALHDSARINPAENIAKGKEILGALMDTMPLAKAYYGSLITIEAGEFAKNKKMITALSYLSKGTGIIDDAIKAAPDLIDIRFIRLVNSYEISEGSPLNRYKEMKKDLDWFDSTKPQLNPEGKATVELYRGFYLIKAKKTDAAMDAFDACIAASPDSPEAAVAKKQLERYAD